MLVHSSQSQKLAAGTCQALRYCLRDKTLAILPEGVALSEQLMQHDEYNRMRRYIYPSAFFRALREGLKLYYELKKMRLKLALGLSPNDRELQIMNVIAHLEMKSKQKSGSRTGETTEATGAGGSLQRQTETQANSRMRW